MKKIIVFWFFLVFCLVSCGLFQKQQQPFVIGEPSPRVVVVEIPGKRIDPNQNLNQSEEYFSAVYPDVTKGYIENKTFPYYPKVWLVSDGKKIALVGPEQGPPTICEGEIREFNLPPGIHILHIERWQKLPSFYGGWRRVGKTEIIKLGVAQFEPGRYQPSYYGWRIIIYLERSAVYGADP